MRSRNRFSKLPRYVQLCIFCCSVAVSTVRADSRPVLFWIGGPAGPATGDATPVKELAAGLGASAVTNPSELQALWQGLRLDAGTMPLDLLDQLDRGHAEWITGNFAAAVGILDGALAAVRRDPIKVIASKKLASLVHRSLVDLAMSHARMNNTALGRATLEELIRSFPDQPVAKAQHGPDAVALYNDARRAIVAAGTGKLQLHAKGRWAGPNYGLYVDEQPYLPEASEGDNALTLPVGRYRVVAASPDRMSSIHIVEVHAGTTTEFIIDETMESPVRFSADGVFVEVPAFDKLGKPHRTALGFFGDLSKRVRRPILVAVQTPKGAAELWLFDSGTQRRRMQANATAWSVLARSVLQGEALAGVTDLSVVRVETVAPKPKRFWPVAMLTSGVLAAGAGAVLLHFDDTCSLRSNTGDCVQRRNLAAGGWSLVGLGGSVGVAGLAWLIFQANRPAGSQSALPTVTPWFGDRIGLSVASEF